MRLFRWLVICSAALCPICAWASQTVVERGSSETVKSGPAGKLVYATDERGNRLPDFSHVGYHSGEKVLPDVPVRMTLAPADGDDTKRIQSALDKLGDMPQDANGHRGALLLKRGVYRVEGSLRIKHSGAVLRGEGSGPDGTVLVAAGYDKPQYKRRFIIVGNGDRIRVDTESKRAIADAYVPVGTHSFSVTSAEGYAVGDRIAVHRPSTAKWISTIGCDRLPSRWERRDGKRVDRTVQWKPGTYDFYFERQITALDGNRVTIDAPVVHAMQEKYGGGAVFHYEAPGRVTEVGIENVRLVSEFGPPVPGNPYGKPKLTRSSEKHAWNAIKLSRNTENTWVRNVKGNYFGWSVVSASGKRATVQDCVSLGHASRITGGRRYPFMIDGQLNLMQRCITFEGRHEFVNQARTAGPNVFVDCIGFDSKSSAGPHHRYAIGNLYDNVRSGSIMESRYRGSSGTGHGWAGTQTCFYNCVARGFNVKAPPGGISWVIGSGKRDTKGIRVSPASIYYQQVKDRLGKDALKRLASEDRRSRIGQYRWVRDALADETKCYSERAF